MLPSLAQSLLKILYRSLSPLSRSLALALALQPYDGATWMAWAKLENAIGNHERAAFYATRGAELHNRGVCEREREREGERAREREREDELAATDMLQQTCVLCEPRRSARACACV